MMIQRERLHCLRRTGGDQGSYVLYWMQTAQRAWYNHALEYAIEEANARKQPLVTLFVLMDRYPEGRARHYAFMLEGLIDTQNDLKERGIAFILEKGDPLQALDQWGETASLLITDGGYLAHERNWRTEGAKRASCPFLEVETNVVVPVTRVSGKKEYSAATLRRKITPLLNTFLVPMEHREVRYPYQGQGTDLKIGDEKTLLAELEVDREVAPVSSFAGGYGEARAYLKDFMDGKLFRYHELKNDPALQYTSYLSPYLHMGQISPLEIALMARRVEGPGSEAFLEELIVRRELSFNYVLYEKEYANLAGLPDWARKTLQTHREDPRPYLYSLHELEAAQTHDPYWNAAQKEMMLTGHMHGYMRMYWGKKILEWSPTPEDAFSRALYLNNKYSLDGRNPNAYAGIAWCFGCHDRAWAERRVYGKVRYMNDRGLERKFAIKEYVDRVEELARGKEA